MLIMTEEQMSNLSQVPLKQFEQDMFIYLSKNFPEDTQNKSKQELQTLIHNGIEQAEKYQIEYEDDMRRYLEFMVMYTQDFDKNPDTAWAHKTLLSKKLDGTSKMDTIDELELEIVRNSI